MMRWLPIALNFRNDLRASLELGDPARRLESLAALSQFRLGFLETLQLDRALDRVVPGLGQVQNFSRLKLALLASSTVDHLAPAIRVAGLRRNLLIDVRIGEYGQYRQELLDPALQLREFAPQVVLFSLTAQDVIASVPLTAAAAEVENAIARSIDELRLLWEKARDLKTIVIQQNFLNVTEPLFGSYDRLVPGAPTSIIGRLNDRLSEAMERESVLLLDVARATERHGIDVWFDTGRWLQGKLEIAPQAAALYGDMVARVVAAQYGRSKKCLVLDLDNTLWGGVIGDDGLEGIVLGEGSAAGESYLALQQYAKRLKERGIILAICTKNDPALAELAFNEHPEMVLKRTDIAAFVADWNDKAENLKVIASRLNIGLDSLVFVDDNPVERARIRQSLPMVAVPELPEDPADYVRCLASAGYFEAIVFTSEDRQRAGQYTANVQRDALLETSGSMENFLRSLKMSVTYGPFAPIDLVRVTQLINKTNQFNATTRRYTAEEIIALASAPDVVTLQFRLLDRFGDNGLVSALILRPSQAEPEVLEIDNWVMSCRVFGRQLEFEAMNIAVETARRRGARAFRAEYLPTARNKVISGLYSSLGFTRIKEAASTNDPTRWALNLAEYAVRGTYIARPGCAK